MIHCMFFGVRVALAVLLVFALYIVLLRAGFFTENAMFCTSFRKQHFAGASV